MGNPTYHLYLDSQERKVAIHSLVGLKNDLIARLVCWCRR